MKHVLAVLLVVASTSVAFGYVGATVTVNENDNTSLTSTVFAIPAAANMPGAQLVYDNSALLLPFSTLEGADAVMNITMPLTAPGITINALAYVYGTGEVTAVDNSLGYFTNTENAATDSHFPTHIARPGRDPWVDYTAVQFAPDQAVQQLGVFVAQNSNRGATGDGNNIKLGWRDGELVGRHLYVAVLGAGDTFATAQYTQIDVTDMYAPFIQVASNGTDLIQSVCVVQDAGVESGAPFGFFDVYTVTPEPCTLLLAGLGLLGIAKRRFAK
jgi:hypothetical protein